MEIRRSRKAIRLSKTLLLFGRNPHHCRSLKELASIPLALKAMMPTLPIRTRGIVVVISEGCYFF
jgi:hypothetical protein